MAEGVVRDNPDTVLGVVFNIHIAVAPAIAGRAINSRFNRGDPLTFQRCLRFVFRAQRKVRLPVREVGHVVIREHFQFNIRKLAYQIRQHRSEQFAHHRVLCSQAYLTHGRRILPYQLALEVLHLNSELLRVPKSSLTHRRQLQSVPIALKKLHAQRFFHLVQPAQNRGLVNAQYFSGFCEGSTYCQSVYISKIIPVHSYCIFAT